MLWLMRTTFLFYGHTAQLKGHSNCIVIDYTIYIAPGSYRCRYKYIIVTFTKSISRVVIKNMNMMNVTTKEMASLYASTSAEYIQNRMAEILLSSATFSPTDVVLDVGCGPGIVTQQIAPLVKSVIGNNFGEKKNLLISTLLAIF